VAEKKSKSMPVCTPVDSPKQRAVTTNDPTMLPDVDGRNPWRLRFRDIVHALVADVGGPERVSAAQMVILQNVAGHAVETERLMARLATCDTGAHGNTLDRYIRAAGGLKRLIEGKAPERATKTIDMTVSEYLSQPWEPDSNDS